MKKTIILLTAVLLAAALSGCVGKAGANDEYGPCGYEALTGCWVMEDEEGLRYCLQFFSNGKVYAYSEQKGNESTGGNYFSKHDDFSYYTEADGTLLLGGNVTDYERSGDVLKIRVDDETTQVFKLFDKNISHIKEYGEQK